jgi:hypothetical protein
VEGFLSKLTDLTYEIVGVLMPGLILLFLGLFQWGLYRHYADPEATGGRLLGLLQEDLLWLEKHPWGILLGALVLSYFAGRAVLFLARDGLPILGGSLVWVAAAIAGKLKIEADRLKKRVAAAPLVRLLARVFLVRTPKELLDNHASSLDRSKTWCTERLSPSSDVTLLSEWSAFYSVASRLLEREGSKSRLPVHQSKYTLDRSLATVFALGFWSAVAFSLLFKTWGPFAEVPVFLFLVHVFDQEHAYHWRLWGDSIIAETYALVWRRQK